MSGGVAALARMAWDEKLAYAVNAFFGAALGAAIHLFGLGGLSAHLTARAVWWNGFGCLVLLAGIGAVIGFISYRRRHHEYYLPLAGSYEGSGGAALLVRRVVALVGAVVAVYFIYQLAR